MAKINRSSLKLIVKECLVEILQEGLSGTESTNFISESSNGLKRPKRRSAPRRNALDLIQHSASEKNKNQDFDKRIKNNVSSMTDDPVLSDILSDTAKTTLQEQFSADRKGPSGTILPSSANGDVAARAVAASSPEDIFGNDVSSKWAKLAFGRESKKSNT